MKQINVGVIGLGHNGMAFCERYARNSASKLTAVCDVDSSRLDAAVDKFNVKGYSGYDILLDKDIDLISIHTPDHLHAVPFIKAVETGHHVFVEKPMADSEEDLAAMLNTARKYTGKVYAVGHVLRFDRYFSLVKKWIDMGLLGDIFYVECDYIHDLRSQYQMEEWKVKREIPMLGGGCHSIDLLRWMVGDVEEVSSISNNIAYPEMSEDASMLTMLKFKSGCMGKVASLYGNASPRPYAFNLTIYGTKGSVVRDKVSFDGMGDSWMDIPVAFDERHDYMPEIDHLLDCIANGKRVLVPPEEGFKTSLAGLYAVKSAKEGKRLVLPEI